MKVQGNRPRTSSIDRMVSDLAPIHEDALLHSPSGGSSARNLTQSLPITGSKVGWNSSTFLIQNEPSHLLCLDTRF